jgi:hypothetical protein
MLGHVVPVYAVSVAPAFFTITSMIQLVVIIRNAPYFKLSINSFHAGICSAKIVLGFLAFLVNLVNLRNTVVPAAVLTAIQVVLPLICAIVVGVTMEIILRRVIVSSTLTLYDKIEDVEEPIVNLSLLEMGLRFIMNSRSETGYLEKLFEMMMNKKIESFKILQVQAIFIVYYLEQQPEFACHLLRKSYKFKPNILQRFSIAQRLSSIDRDFSDTINLDALRKDIDNAKKKQTMIRGYFRDFWKLYLNDSATDSSVSKIIQRADQCVKDCQRIFNSMLIRYPKSHQAMRAYANFIEEVMNDSETASSIYAEADHMEEDEVKAKRRSLLKKQKQNVNEASSLMKALHHLTNSANKVNPSVTVAEEPVTAGRRNRSGSIDHIDSYGQADIFIGNDNVSEDFSFTRDENRRREMLMHKAIMRKDEKWIFRGIILSIIGFSIAVLVSLIVVVETNIHAHSAYQLYRGCRSGSITYEALHMLRQLQHNGNFSNDEIHAFRTNIEIQGADIHKFTDQGLSDSLSTAQSSSAPLWEQQRFEVYMPLVMNRNGSDVPYTSNNLSLYDVCK